MAALSLGWDQRLEDVSQPFELPVNPVKHLPPKYERAPVAHDALTDLICFAHGVES